MKTTKLVLGVFLGIFSIIGISFLPTYADDEGDQGGDAPTNVDGRSTEAGFTNSGGWKGQDSQYNANVAGSKTLQGDSLIKTIQTAINWVLGILSMIALVLCLRGGFQMMTSGGDSKKYESGLNVLKWAAIGLAIIAASWLIVSLIFFVINGSIKGSGTDISGKK